MNEAIGTIALRHLEEGFGSDGLQDRVLAMGVASGSPSTALARVAGAVAVCRADGLSGGGLAPGRLSARLLVQAADIQALSASDIAR
jgi:hypothetical protein